MNNYAALIKDKAKALGFSYCGIAKAEYLEKEAPLLEQWLMQGKNGEMKYMENYFDMRLDPRKLVPGAQSVISLLYNYYTTDRQPSETQKISKYAYGEDYHIVIKDKLKELLLYIQTHIGEVSGRAFADSAPVLEKAWAKRSGLGWVGKNSNLINKQAGSFFFLSELIIDLPLPADAPMAKDYCGTCTACIDACPTQAIEKPGQVNGARCISYFTIELKSAIPQSMKGQFDDWMFGCDVCQDVCPWNRFSKPHQEPRFSASPQLLQMKRNDWIDLTEEVFKDLFPKSAVKRAKFMGLKRNIQFLDSPHSPNED
jgi:epoxyqueuosine reductase